MAIVRAATPIMHFDDDNGLALSGGILCTYVAGTSTPIATYKNKECSLNPTRIVLDSRGECDIWLDPAQSYKFVLKRADGSVVWTKDDITADAVYELPSRIVDTVEGSGDVDVTSVASGNSTKYVVKLTEDFKEEVEAIETALGNVKDAFYFTNDTEGPAFADAYSKGNFLVYQKGVTSGAPRPETTTRNFILVSENRRAGGSSVTLLFACLDGETIYKVNINFDIVAQKLTFGDVESYAVKDKDDELALAVASASANAEKNVFKFLKGYSTLEDIRDALSKGKAILMPTFVEDGTGKNYYNELYFLKQEDDYVWCFFRIDGSKYYEVKLDFTNSRTDPTITEVLTELATKTEVQGKLSAVSHDATIDGDGTEANPLKVIGGGGSSTIFSVDGEKLLIQNNVRVEQELLIV